MKKILIIENEKHINNLLAKILALQNYEILQAFNGREGILQIIKQKPDLVICDIKMPLMTGWEFICLYKRMGKVSHIPIIFLTAKVQQSDMDLAYSLGVDAYLTKPFDLEELLPEVKRMLGSYIAQKSQVEIAEQLFLTGQLSLENEIMSYKVNLEFFIERLSQEKKIAPSILEFLKAEDSRITEFFKQEQVVLEPLKKADIQTVFSVDDDDFQNLLNERLIGKVIPHAKVKTFNHPEKLLEHLNKNGETEPDLMLLDIYMPNMNGFELLKELNTRELFIPTFMVSAATQTQQHRPSRYSSIYAFIGKPLNEDKLNELLK